VCRGVHINVCITGPFVDVRKVACDVGKALSFIIFEKVWLEMAYRAFIRNLVLGVPVISVKIIGGGVGFFVGMYRKFVECVPNFG
jgi:hypothetical protein